MGATAEWEEEGDGSGSFVGGVVRLRARVFTGPTDRYGKSCVPSTRKRRFVAAVSLGIVFLFSLF
jgi:hypothetical protein